LVRISRLREGPEGEKHSVLKSVDQLLRDQCGYQEGATFYGSGRSGGRRGPSGLVISPCASEEDKSIELIASTFRSDHRDDYSSLRHDKFGEVSPLAESELGHMAAMPLLEDMPTRSRRLLEDIHRAEGGGSSGNMGHHKGKYDVSSQGLTHPFRNVL
jgi:hypothetical protein